MSVWDRGLEPAVLVLGLEHPVDFHDQVLQVERLGQKLGFGRRPAALQRDGRQAEAYALLAHAWQGQQLAARALEAAGTAVRLAPDEPAHRLQHAALLMEHGRLADAVEEYLVARTFRPHDPVLLDGLASAPRTFFERELRIGRLVAPEIVRGLAIAALSVGLAWRGFGVWSLVWGDILGAALKKRLK